jgi:hypothetical protein
MGKFKMPVIKLKENILHHLIQGIIVFASVFLAFWLTEVRENNKTRKEVEIALKTIAIEMSYNHDRIITTFNYHHNISQQIDSIMNENPNEIEGLYGIHLKGWQGIQLPMLRSTAYKTLTNSGLISNLNFETQKTLAEIYTVQKIIEDFDNTMIASAVNDLEFARLVKVRHLSGLFTDILPNVIGSYQMYGRSILENNGYEQQLDSGLLKTVVDERFQKN